MTKNWVSSVAEAVRARGDAPAVWTPKSAITFAELRDFAARAQRLFRRSGLRAGDSALVLDLPGPRLYGAVIGLLGLGVRVVFVEPWMAPSKIDRALRLLAPKLLLAPVLGRLWGLRVSEVRQIPRWIRPRAIEAESAGELVIEEVDAHEPAMVAFSSGTSGEPKGVVRTHGYLSDLVDVINRHDPSARDARPDLAIFANVVLLRLAQARTTLLVPSSWSRSSLEQMGALPDALQPSSAACGPAFLSRLVATPGFPRLGCLEVGGALTDCDLFEAAFARFPDAVFEHVYGGTEVEPVALADAREAVKKSRARGHFQTLNVGEFIPELQVDPQASGLWVAGPNVCPEYLGGLADNQAYKRRDEEGRLWHFMGDRVERDADGCWYAGRSFQSPEDFRDEQAIYAQLRSSRSFLHRTPSGRSVLVGESVVARRAEILRAFPRVSEVVEARIERDARHRARRATPSADRPSEDAHARREGDREARRDALTEFTAALADLSSAR